MTPLLDVRNLHLSLLSAKGWQQILRDLSFCIYAGEIVGLVGESGCGKSLTAAALLQILPPLHRLTGQFFFKGQARLPACGKEIAFIPQNPTTALNPVLTIGIQLSEGLRYHCHLSRQQAKEKAYDWLERVGVSDPKQRFNQYPHELSGGMKQRVMIAMALACKPALVIADEPTTALDLTIQLQILQLLKQLQREEQMSLLLITHDKGVVAHCCQRVLVLSDGQIVKKCNDL